MRILFILLSVLSLPAFAAGDFFRLDTRADVTVPVFYMKHDSAKATVILLPGGSGGFGHLVDGEPSSNNFLVRTRDYFHDAGFNVAVMGRASDMDDLDFEKRISPEHLQDIKTLVEYVRKDSGLPVWLVGTSRGTVSATAAAIAFGKTELGGIVLTSSIVSRNKTGAVPSQDLEKITIPVLVVHHSKDACPICSPDEVPEVIAGLKNAAIKKLVFVDGGNPKGKPCKAKHYHGFFGIENSTVELIASWIKNPQN